MTRRRARPPAGDVPAGDDGPAAAGRSAWRCASCAAGSPGSASSSPASRSASPRSPRSARCGRRSTTASPARRRRCSAATPRSSSPTASPTPTSAPGWTAHAAAVSEIVDFRSMLAVPRAGGEPERTLVQVKAVDGALSALRRGRARRRRQPRRRARRRATACPASSPRRRWSTGSASRPAPWSASAPRTSASPTRSSPSPTRLAAGFALRPAGDRAPRRPRGERPARRGLAVRLLLPPAARARRRPRARCGRGRGPLRRRRAAVARPPQRRRPGIGRFVDRLGSFLVLVGLAGLAVGGVGVAAAVRAHLEAQDRDHRHAEDARRHRRHGLRGLPDPDRRSSPLARHRARPRRSARRCRSSRRPFVADAAAGAGRVRPLPAARWPRRRSTAA